MVDIRGFSGLRFNAEMTGALDHVLTPPYDVIDEHERARLAAGSPFNMTHLILPESDGAETPHARAGSLFRHWIAEGVLQPDPEPSLYVLRQRFSGPDGMALERRSFFGILKLPEENEKYILGHERTFGKPVEDRLALVRAARANLEPIFVMYSDPENKLGGELFAVMDQHPPLLCARTSDDVLQEVWRIPCPAALAPHFEQQTLYIADGHHRFKTACAYRDERRSATDTTALHGYDYVMAGFVAFEESGLKIYAAHRVVPASFTVDVEQFLQRLSAFFDCKPFPEDDVDAALTDAADAGCVLALQTADRGAWLLTLDESKRNALVGNDRSPAWQALDVAVLHRGILGNLLGVADEFPLIYEKEAAVARSLVKDGKAALAFLLCPTRPEQVRACAEDFEPMPQKSTYFFPKLPSGAVIYDFEHGYACGR